MKTFAIQRVETFDNSSGIKVTVNGKEETYSLTEAPALRMTLVERERVNILQRLDLNSVIANLDNANGLLFVAHNALAGTHIQSKISGLQKELQDLCIKSMLAITSFQENIEEILGLTTTAYRYLYECKESMAMKKLQRCTAYAEDMQRQCSELSKGFDSMALKTQAALEASQDEQATRYQQMTEIRTRLNEMQAEQDARVKSNEMLQLHMEEVSQLYEEAKQKEEEAAKEERTIRLVSAITGGLTGIVGGVASSIGSAIRGGSGKTAGTAASGASASSITPEEQALLDKKRAQSDNLTELKRQQTENQTKKNALLAEISQIQADIASIDVLKAELAAVDTTADMSEEQKAEKKKELTALIQKKETDLPAMQQTLISKKAQSDTISTHEADCATAVTAASDALDNLNKQMETLSAKSEAALQEAKNESKTLLKQKFELEKQNRELLSTMAKFATLIQGTTAQGNQAETAVQTLQVAVLCLKQIAVALANAALFWSSVERFCRKLAQSKLAEDIQDLQDFSPEERLQEYKRPEFTLTLLSYLCSWVALGDVCTKYLDAAQQTKEQIQENIKKGYLPEESWKLAAEQAHSLLDSVNAQIAVSDEAQKQLQDAQASL